MFNGSSFLELQKTSDDLKDEKIFFDSFSTIQNDVECEKSV